jgi:hypothetical protein
MLFVVDKNGVPSAARRVDLKVDDDDDDDGGDDADEQPAFHTPAPNGGTLETSRRQNMDRRIIGGLALVCGFAVAASADNAAKKSTKGGKGVTLTGCLQAGTSPGTFRLTNVTGGPAATNTEWELMDAPASLKMADHVGHKVAVTGTVMGTGQAKKAEGEQSARSESAQRHLHVQSFKHVAATCS